MYAGTCHEGQSDELGAVVRGRRGPVAAEFAVGRRRRGPVFLAGALDRLDNQVPPLSDVRDYKTLVTSLLGA